MDTQKNDMLTITLTDRNPVKIAKSDWPILAIAEDKEFDNQYEFQANRTSKWKIIVRENKDGRAIIYGIYSYSSAWAGEKDRSVRGGEITTTKEQVIPAIKRVAVWMGDHTGENDTFDRLAHECIACLPAEEI